MAIETMAAAMKLLDVFDSSELQDPLNENWAARRALTEATRKLIANMVTCSNDTQELSQVAAVINEQAEKLVQGPRLQGRAAYEKTAVNGDFARLCYELSPLDGKSNPIAAPITVWTEGERIYGRANMGWQYEGPYQSVHGGFVAALFDQLLGAGQKLTGQPGFTGTLTVKYLKLTPLNTELKMEGWVERIEGRKNYLAGEIWAGDKKTATCEAIFISPVSLKVGH